MFLVHHILIVEFLTDTPTKLKWKEVTAPLRFKETAEKMFRGIWPIYGEVETTSNKAISCQCKIGW